MLLCEKSSITVQKTNLITAVYYFTSPVTYIHKHTCILQVHTTKWMSQFTFA